MGHPKHAECDVKWTQRLQALPVEEVLPPVPDDDDDDDDDDWSDGYERQYLKLPRQATLFLQKIDRHGMPNCSTITVQQDTPRTRT